eukprot:g4565.t2
MKTESDQLRSSLRESNTKLITQESQIERFSKELKQKKEQITWLQEQFTLKKKEAESTTIKLQETLQKYHQKHEEAEQLKTELKNAQHELSRNLAAQEQMKLHHSRLQSEKESELRHLGQELASKTEALHLLEISAANSQQLSEEQKRFLADAAQSEHLQKKINELKIELTRVNEKLTEFQNLADTLSHQKTELEEHLRDYEQIKEERNRLATGIEVNRKLKSENLELKSDRDRMQCMINELQLDRDRDEKRIQHLSKELDCVVQNSDAYEQSSNRVKCELQQKDQELHGIRAAYVKLEEENQKLYNHVDYAEKEIVMAKEAINAKQGILDNERAMGAGERKVHESLGQLVHSLKTNLADSRRQISELTSKDKRAADAIAALEKKLKVKENEHLESQSYHQHLKKKLQASEGEVRLLQQTLSGTKAKLDTYKNQVGNLRDEMAATERSNGDSRSSMREALDPQRLQERIKFLEAELISERNSHTVTKQLLIREGETHKFKIFNSCILRTPGSTHVSTPYPRAGSSFRFSYARPGDRASHGTGETPFLPPGQDGESALTPLSAGEVPTEGDHSSSVVTIDPRAIPAKDVPKDPPPVLTPVHETDAVSEVDDGAMEVDHETTVDKMSMKFSTPGPRAFHDEAQYSQRQYQY